MAKIELTKAQIIKILSKEPLVPGRFLSGKRRLGYSFKIVRFEPPSYKEDSNACMGCAVGQIFRNVCYARNAVGLNGHVASQTKVWTAGTQYDSLIQKDYLSALSCEFERLARVYNKTFIFRSPNHPLKLKLIQFVQANFPPTLTLDIDGFAPKRGVKVLR